MVRNRSSRCPSIFGVFLPEVPSRFQNRRRLCALRPMFRRRFVHRAFRRWRLCTLETQFRRGFVHRDREVLYKPPRKRPSQCAKPWSLFSVTVQTSSRTCPPEYSPALYAGDLVAEGLCTLGLSALAALYTRPPAATIHVYPAFRSQSFSLKGILYGL